MWEPWESVSFKPAGDGFEDEGLFCHDQAERTYLLQYGAESMYTKVLLMWARRRGREENSQRSGTRLKKKRVPLKSPGDFSPTFFHHAAAHRQPPRTNPGLL